MASIRQTALRAGQWDWILGWRLGELTVGVIEVGRIGRKFIGFGSRVLASDLAPSDLPSAVEWVDKKTLSRRSDMVTLHVPLTLQTRGLIGAPELGHMKPSATLINTSCGGVGDEASLAQALRGVGLRAAAVDVFCDEPYTGEMPESGNCLITYHMGSMAADCCFRVEYGAACNVVNFFGGETVDQFVPESEYALRHTALGA